MKRNLNAMGIRKYDLIVIGGGINGVSVAWDAALRGLTVALVEKKDFGHATSYNTLGIIHGGLRYLQRFDIKRCLRYLKEQLVFFNIAPHLVRPLPFVIPTYSHFMYGKELLGIGAFIYKLLKSYVNNTNLSGNHNNYTTLLSKQQCLELINFLDSENLTGAVTYCDGQVLNSERLTLSIAKSAEVAGADLANYAEAFKVIKDSKKIIGLCIKDLISGTSTEIYGHFFVNTTGPWINNIIDKCKYNLHGSDICFTKGFNVTINRNINENMGIGIIGPVNGIYHKKSKLQRKRYFFAVPSGDSTTIGTEHLNTESRPGDFRVTDEEVSAFIKKVNMSHRAISVKLNEIIEVTGGLLPSIKASDGHYILYDKYKIIDHEIENGIKGMISVIGTKYTEARYLAEKVVDMVFSKIYDYQAECLTHITPVYGGDFTMGINNELDRLCNKYTNISRSNLEEFVVKYGTAAEEVLKYMNAEERIGGRNEDYMILRCQINHAIIDEMAQNLEDVVLRRISSNRRGNLNVDYLKKCCEIIAIYLGWDKNRISNELNSFDYQYYG